MYKRGWGAKAACIIQERAARGKRAAGRVVHKGEMMEWERSSGTAGREIDRKGARHLVGKRGSGWEVGKDVWVLRPPAMPAVM